MGDGDGSGGNASHGERPMKLLLLTSAVRPGSEQAVDPCPRGTDAYANPHSSVEMFIAVLPVVIKNWKAPEYPLTTDRASATDKLWYICK